MQKLVEMMKDKSAFSGSNAEFMEEFKSYTGIEIHTNVMKKMMKKHRSELEENGVTFEDCKRMLSETLDSVAAPCVPLCELSYRRSENKPTEKHARIWANVGALSPLIKTR